MEFLDCVLVELLMHTQADIAQLQRPLAFLARAIGVASEGAGGAGTEATYQQKLFRYSTNRVVSALAHKLTQSGQFWVVARALRIVAIHTVRDSVDDDSKLDTLLRDKFLPMSEKLSSAISQVNGPTPLCERQSALHALERLLRLLGRTDKVCEESPSHGASHSMTVASAPESSALTADSNLNRTALDPFVPKVMKTLTSALQTRELRRDACSVWGSFVALISQKTLEANLPSIIVSLWPAALEEAAEAVEQNNGDRTSDDAQQRGHGVAANGDAGIALPRVAQTFLYH